jgi:glycine dehydrogenase subunit 1
MYLALMGKTGLRDVASLNLERSRELATAVSKLDGVDLKFSASFFNEIVVDVHQPARDVLAKLAERKILGGVDLGRWYPELSTCILMNATELTTTAQIDQLATSLGDIVRVHANV